MKNVNEPTSQFSTYLYHLCLDHEVAHEKSKCQQDDDDFTGTPIHIFDYQKRSESRRDREHGCADPFL